MTPETVVPKELFVLRVFFLWLVLCGAASPELWQCSAAGSNDLRITNRPVSSAEVSCVPLAAVRPINKLSRRSFARLSKANRDAVREQLPKRSLARRPPSGVGKALPASGISLSWSAREIRGREKGRRIRGRRECQIRGTVKARERTHVTVKIVRGALTVTELPLWASPEKPRKWAVRLTGSCRNPTITAAPASR